MQQKSEKNDNFPEIILNRKINSGDVIDRVKQLLKIENDMKLAHAFKMSQNTVYSWRARNNADILFILNKINELHQNRAVVVDTNWLLYGEGYGEIVKSIENANGLIQTTRQENISLKKELEETKNLLKSVIKMMGENSK